MSDVGDLQVLPFGIVIKWPVKLFLRFFFQNVFYHTDIASFNVTQKWQVPTTCRLFYSAMHAESASFIK